MGRLYANSLAGLYTFRDYAQVDAFLTDHRDLVPLLMDTYQVIQCYFGRGTAVALEVVTDPEVEADRQLVAFIQTGLRPREAIDRLEELDRAWWLSASRLSDGLLCIHVECRS